MKDIQRKTKTGQRDSLESRTLTGCKQHHPPTQGRQTMLILNRKPGQSIQIAGNITVSVVRSSGNSVRLAISAPKEIRIVRTELPKKGAAA